MWAKYRGIQAKYYELAEEAKYWGGCAKYCASTSVYKLQTCCASGGVGTVGGHVTMHEGGHPHWLPLGKLGTRNVLKYWAVKVVKVLCPRWDVCNYWRI